MNVNPIPEGMNMLIPHLVVKNATKAIEFYQQAFAAEVTHRMMTPDGKKVMHAGLKIAGQDLFLCDEMKGNKAPNKNQSSVTLHLYVGDADMVFNRALKLGAKELMPLQNTFWGDRYGQLKDPFGHQWAIAAKVEEVTPEEMLQRSQQMMGKK